MSFLLDTDICSNYFRRPGPLFHRFVQHSGQLHISAITLGELYSWTLRNKTARRYSASLHDALTFLTVVPLDEAIAYRFGQIRSRLLDQGQLIESLDLLIAATALEHNLTLVTHNTADFVSVPGLTVVDWLSP